MNLDTDQLRTLLAVVDAGSQEAAAAKLGITASAVSQRLTALERTAGQTLLARSKPVKPTGLGETLLKYARQIDRLLLEGEDELRAESERNHHHFVLSAHADSLTTWVLPLLATFDSFTFELLNDHGDDAALRSARAVASITTSATPVQGCITVPLGKLRYRPAATAEFATKWFPNGIPEATVLRAPFVHQSGTISTEPDRVAKQAAPVMRVPPNVATADAVEAGCGWALLPEILIQRRSLSVLEPHRFTDVKLYWKQWSIESTRLEQLRDTVMGAAASVLQSNLSA